MNTERKVCISPLPYHKDIHFKKSGFLIHVAKILADMLVKPSA